MRLRPKLCINSQCSNILYVDASKLHMCLQCEDCVRKKEFK